MWFEGFYNGRTRQEGLQVPCVIGAALQGQA